MRQGTSRVALLLCLAAVALTMPTSVAGPHLSAGKPDRIDVLYMSRSDDWVGEDGYRRDILLRADPSMDVVGVETVGAWSIWYGIVEPEQVNRKMRIYMPRTYEEMVSKYDLVVLNNVAYAHPLEPEVRLDPKWLVWFVKGVREAGMCLAMWGRRFLVGRPRRAEQSVVGRNRSRYNTSL